MNAPNASKEATQRAGRGRRGEWGGGLGPGGAHLAW